MDKEYYIFIRIKEDEIQVQMSTEFIKKDWLQEEKSFVSYVGSDNKILFNPKVQNHIHFFKVFSNISESSKYFINNSFLLYFSKYNFSQILHFFAKKHYYIGYPLNDDYYTLHQYIQHFYILNKKKLNSFDELKSTGIKGCLYLRLQEKVTKKRLPEYVCNGKVYYIIGGVFIMPHSKSLLLDKNIKIEGFLIDTTWRIMNFFVTSIITACVSNSSLPIGFGFGNGETKDLYNFLLSSIEKETDFSFKKKFLNQIRGQPFAQFVKHTKPFTSNVFVTF